MTNSEKVYTYRSGKKLKLHKKPDQFIVRALPDELEQKLGITDAKKVSASSSKITTRTMDLEHLMTESRQIAPTHHAYVVAETNNEFLITDRIFVTFHNAISHEEVGAFAGRYGLMMLQN
ncbi:hypothetical protein PAEAM_28750 [Paenibacillus sp. GM1FR]|uniref:hypothetical protein n=1 Tax=Paenibacillus sp. GM1FR TaxID=2059267 RepID=UPI000CC2004C|nr:hypothetical protein [Paenibacillus sp. GM1FR]PJN59840.1 hypothetical protein PAEAM_28750 [Paenibacillus sp. GM1FR]